MGQWEEAYCCLNQKIQILEKIAANTETQCRFIQNRKMKGLERVLRERAELLEELVAINAALASDQSWQLLPQLVAMMQDTTNKQKEMINRSHQVLQQAIDEKACIAAELKNSKIQRQVKSQYVNPWASMARGHLINERG
ncbi:hypothetical protein [Sporomusa malonica]|uniref:FlgN protein n=1 Tax=Sporomusa malonica TaxID=112901 RepID=A0A1W2EJB7_9FIRM|nr:hypothetical protein [Sporomusa malonica]SMD09793.1 hypothetical protein SAMN04488500_12515 [Sporomusa malonica]